MTGFRLDTQKLHCLVALDDSIGKALSPCAGEAFFRAFVTEERKTGEITARYRFRYADHDSWVELQAPKGLSAAEQIKFLVGAVDRVLFVVLTLFAGGTPPPSEAIMHFYPPNNDDAEATMNWLIAEDLVQVKTVIRNGHETRVSAEPGTVM